MLTKVRDTAAGWLNNIVVGQIATWMPEYLTTPIEMLVRHRRLINAACAETGLSEVLLTAGRSGLSLEQMQDSVTLPQTSLRLLLLLGCSAKLLSRDPKSLRYHATKRLRGRVPSQLYRLYDASPAFLAESAKTGKNAGLQLLPGSGATLYERLAQYPELERIYSAELAHTNEGYRIPLVLEGIRRLQGQVSHVLDIGGNTGVTANAIVNHYPDLRVTVFDLPSVCAKGRAQLTNKSVGFVDGNLGADPVPTGADCVVLSAVLEITPTEQAHALMRRINDALPRGGSVIIVQSATNELETGPLLAASAALYFFNVCSPSPMSICVNDMRLLAADSGFASFEIHRPDDGPMALMIMRK